MPPESLSVGSRNWNDGSPISRCSLGPTGNERVKRVIGIQAVTEEIPINILDYFI